MAHHLSAKKRIRQIESRRVRNKYSARTTRNAVKKLRGTTDKEAAAYALNTLTNLLPETWVQLLPDSFKRPLQYDAFDPGNVLQRTEVVNTMTRDTSRAKCHAVQPVAVRASVRRLPDQT